MDRVQVPKLSHFFLLNLESNSLDFRIMKPIRVLLLILFCKTIINQTLTFDFRLAQNKESINQLDYADLPDFQPEWMVFGDSLNKESGGEPRVRDIKGRGLPEGWEKR